ncbi:MAG: alpha/beta fold hydrolase [Gallintestinimicrobium sp.]|uniref:alpha/beta fold hydrolase n=1 Tax=Gallintestinimicrobium sp. TaxID=2981655 RepID=UPI0039929601
MDVCSAPTGVERRNEVCEAGSPLALDKWVVHPEELAQITAPTLVICGTKDMIREDHTRKIAENIPNARLAIIKGDHFVANKRSEEFNREVDRFLESL